MSPPQCASGQRFRYTVYQTDVWTNFEIEGWPVGERQPEEVWFTVGEAGAPESRGPWGWYHEHVGEDGVAWLSFGRRPGGFILRHREVGDFLVSANGREIRCHPLPDVQRQHICGAFLGDILPLALNARGRDGIHASAVKVDAGAVAFSGVSKAGKSTLAAYLHSLGHPVLADDYVSFQNRDDGVYAGPGFPEISLRSDAARSLGVMGRCASSERTVLRLPPDGVEFWPEPVPLKRIYCLDRRDPDERERHVRVQDLPPSEAFVCLVARTHRLDIHDATVLARQADLFSRLVTEGRVKGLVVGRDFDLLPLAVERILEDLKT